MQNVGTLSTKGQVTIPKKIRDYFGLEKSDQLVFSIIDNSLVVKPIKKDFLEFGASIKPKKEPEDFQKIRKTVKEKVSQKVAKEGK